MLWYNIVSRILPILSIITFALAAPVLVQEKHRAPEDVLAVLEKRSREQELDMLWDGLRYHDRVWGNRPPGVPGGGHLLEPAQPQDVPPPNAAEAHAPQEPAQPPNPAGVQVPQEPVPPPNPAGAQALVVHVPPQGPVELDRESIELNDGSPPRSPTESEKSMSSPPSPGSTKSEDWFSAPESPRSESDSGRWTTISNVPRDEPQSEKLEANSQLKVSLR